MIKKISLFFLLSFLKLVNLNASDNQVIADTTNQKSSKFISIELYNNLLDLKKQIILTNITLEKMAQIDTYIFMYDWEQKTKNPISTLSKEELESLTNNFFKQRVEDLKNQLLISK